MIEHPPGFVLTLPQADQKRVAELCSALYKLARPYAVVRQMLDTVYRVAAAVGVLFLVNGDEFISMWAFTGAVACWIGSTSISPPNAAAKMRALVRNPQERVWVTKLIDEYKILSLLPRTIWLDE